MKKTTLIASLVFCSISMQNYSQSPEDIRNKDSLAAVQDSTQQKRPLTPEDYKLLNTIFFEKDISNNGDWYAYTLQNNHTLEYGTFVGDTKTDTKYDFPFGAPGQFSDNSKWFGCLVKEKGLALLDLKKDKIQWISNVSKFEFLEVGSRNKYLIAYKKPTVSTEPPSLLIMNLANGKQESIPGVTEYQVHRPSNNLAYIVATEGKKSVAFRTLEGAPITTLISTNAQYNYKKLLWSSQGNALTFYQELSEGPEKQKSYKLYHYNAEQKPSKLKYLDPGSHTELFQAMDLTDRSLRISDDGMAVFFEMTRKEHSESISEKSKVPDANVQVWNTKDKRIYPELKAAQMGHAEFGPSLTVWWPEKDKTMILETKELPEAVLANDVKYMLSYNPTAYAPHFKSTGDIDLYLTDLETGQRHLFLKRQEYGRYGFYYNVAFSPKGKYISYFRDKHWWIYDLEQKTHTNATKGLGLQFYETSQDGAHSGVLEPYGGDDRFLSWMPGDKERIIYDRYDVWLISPTGKARRITQGREKQVRYRIDRNSHSDRIGTTQGFLSNTEKEQLIMSQGLVLTTLNTKTMASGYAIWKPETGLKELVYKDMRVSEFIKAKDREAYIYIEESFDTPPRLRYWEKGMSDSKVLAESNPQQKQFQWGHAELVHYTGPEGDPLQGALYYPANYRAGKKYPMIVHIYEMQSNLLHYYVPPTAYLGDGFNPTNYTANGYIVFLPDIQYKFNDVGISALQCVEAGVREVVAKGIVETDHIGLVGHSHGGYETAFIVTQTNMFATAVVGAAVTDLVSFYHSVGWEAARNQLFWFEGQQLRFTDSFYQNPEAYLRNSPLHHAANINTPLLLWTGKQDYWLDWQQSIELYSGLRRLGKEGTLLLYPDEGHSLSNKTNQVDLTRRIKAWFDTYLKPDRTER